VEPVGPTNHEKQPTCVPKNPKMSYLNQTWLAGKYPLFFNDFPIYKPPFTLL
jgi:hypothetical protein